MAVNTINSYGKISVTDESIALVAQHTALDCYGVVDLVNRKFGDALREIFKGKKLGKSRGIKILTIGDRIHVDLDIILKYGVSINAVASLLKSTIFFAISTFCVLSPVEMLL